jgi:CBS-domain-containing membrane protein
MENAMRVEQLMTRNIHTCGPDDSLNRATQVMWEHDCGCVPVVDSERQLIGIVTDRDVAMAAYTQGRSIAHIRVGDIMAKRMHTCGQDEDISVAQDRMRKYQLRRLPITDATGYLVGLISLNDLALEASREGGPGRHPLRSAEVGETLAEVSKHRGADQLVVAAE